MAEKKKTSKKKPAGNPAIAWIVRGVVFGGLAIALGLAFSNYQVKQAAQKTSQAWRQALTSKGENADLLKSEFDKIQIQGSPTTQTDKAPPQNPYGASTLHTYTWKGMFGTYVVKVFFGLGNDPPVDGIEGPGADSQQ